MNAAVIEKDLTVRSAILDLFNNLGDIPLTFQALSQGLLAARDRNRSLLRGFTDSFIRKQTESKMLLVDTSFSEVPIGNPADGEKAPLESSASIIGALVRRGARLENLSHIYCVDCKFSTIQVPARLAGVSFEGAFLRGADFSGADLNSASFKDADLILTDFTSAGLHSANLTEGAAAESWTVAKVRYSGELAGTYGARLACADLSDADFSGRVAFGPIYGDQVYGGNTVDEFYKANLTGTRMRGIRFSSGAAGRAVGSANLFECPT